MLSLMKLDPKLETKFTRVISIVCPSRSGSTVFKHALSQHPDLCSLNGEEEPYYKLAENGFPWHMSDRFTTANNPDTIRCLVANELHNYELEFNRKVLQDYKVEEPPYVDPVGNRVTDTLLLKTPQNCYRRGVLEQLFPEAEIVYIRIKRNPFATVNGLVDGWLSGDFTARKTSQGWWCFDMPPNWDWKVNLYDRCANQLLQSTFYLDRDYKDVACTVQFEELCDGWISVCQEVWSALGLGPYTPSDTVLPVLMATDNPQKDRWKRKRPWLRDLKTLQSFADYS